MEIKATCMGADDTSRRIMSEMIWSEYQHTSWYYPRQYLCPACWGRKIIPKISQFLAREAAVVYRYENWPVCNGTGVIWEYGY